MSRHASFPFTTPTNILIVRVIRELRTTALEHDGVVVLVGFACEHEVLLIAGTVVQAVHRDGGFFWGFTQRGKQRRVFADGDFVFRVTVAEKKDKVK